MRWTPRVYAGVFISLASACDKQPADGASLAGAGRPEPRGTASAPAAPPEPRAPDIIVDRSRVAVGADRVPADERALADRIAALMTGWPVIAGRSVDFVAMRDAKPSRVAAIVAALQRARATGANVKTEARDGTTQSVPLAFATGVQDCTTIAWIAKDDAIDVWPAGGGRAKRVIRGLAGPDMTLGTEAVRAHQNGCGASELVVGADDAISWGLVFDLTMNALHGPGARASSVVLVTSAVPGRKLELNL
jgi:hypothetical protein